MQASTAREGDETRDRFHPYKVRGVIKQSLMEEIRLVTGPRASVLHTRPARAADMSVHERYEPPITPRSGPISCSPISKAHIHVDGSSHRSADHTSQGWTRVHRFRLFSLGMTLTPSICCPPRDNSTIPLTLRPIGMMPASSLTTQPLARSWPGPR